MDRTARSSSRGRRTWVRVITATGYGIKSLYFAESLDLQGEVSVLSWNRAFAMLESGHGYGPRDLR